MFFTTFNFKMKILYGEVSSTPHTLAFVCSRRPGFSYCGRRGPVRRGHRACHTTDRSDRSGRRRPPVPSLGCGHWGSAGTFGLYPPSATRERNTPPAAAPAAGRWLEAAADGSALIRRVGPGAHWPRYGARPNSAETSPSAAAPPPARRRRGPRARATMAAAAPPTAATCGEGPRRVNDPPRIAEWEGGRVREGGRARREGGR